MHLSFKFIIFNGEIHGPTLPSLSENLIPLLTTPRTSPTPLPTPPQQKKEEEERQQSFDDVQNSRITLLLHG